MGLVRLGDLCSGHDGYEPRPSIEASSNVFVNGIAVCREGDHWDIHCRRSCHDGVLVGNPDVTVYVNGLRVGRPGDAISCGSVVQESSGNVFASEV